LCGLTTLFGHVVVADAGRGFGRFVMAFDVAQVALRRWCCRIGAQAGIRWAFGESGCGNERYSGCADEG
tara:strand:- start:493 stop:699 length:207 start_codon:yes stop_codon:yes gene_type:complete